MPTNQNPPQYLSGKLKDIQIKQISSFLKHPDWFDSLGWKGQLVLEELGVFSIYHSGICDSSDGAIYTQDNEPLVLIGKYLGGEKQCVIFDQRIHGFNCFVQDVEHLQQEPVDLKQYNYKNYKNEYQVYIYGNSSVDFQDEFDQNSQGLIKIKDSYWELDYLKSNAFDFIGVLLINEFQEEIKILEMELV